MSGVGVPMKHRLLDESEDEDEDDEDEMLLKRSKKYSASSASSGFPSTTTLVPEGQDFKTGDFVVLKEDVERESAPIWR